MKLLKFSFLLLLFNSTVAHSDQAQTIQALLNSFGSSCSIQGNQSRRLNDAAINLSHILEAAIYSDECKGFGSVAINVRGALDRLASESPRYTDAERDYEALISKRNSLVASIAVETDVTLSGALKTNLQDTQVSIAELSREIVLDEYNNRNQRLLDAARSYQAATDAFLSTLSHNEQCLIRFPGLLSGVGSVGLALAQSSTLAVSTGGASVLAGAGIFTVSRVIQFMKDKKNQKLLMAITDPMLPSALSCAMESLNEIYCESDGVEKLGTFVLSPQYSVQTFGNYEVFQGLEHLEKALPTLDNTLNYIKVGTEPSSGIDGILRSEINTQKTILQGTQQKFAGWFSELRRNVLTIDPGLVQQKKRELIFSKQKQFINNFLNSVGIFSLTGNMNSSAEESPLAFDNFKGEFARFYLMGFDPRKMNFNDFATVKFENLLIEGAYNGSKIVDPWKEYAGEDTHFYEDLGQFQARVTARFVSWYNEAQVRLDNQSKLILKTDKKEILASLDEPISRDYKLTPIVVMQKLSSFITSPSSQKYLKIKYKRIAYEVAAVLDEIMTELNSIPFDLPEDQFQKKVDEVFAKILAITHYSNEPRFLVTRLTAVINAIIAQASIELYQNGNKDLIYSLASADMVKELKSYAGKQKSTIDMINDAKKVKGQIVPTISAFVDAFKDVIEKNLILLAKPENRSRRVVERGHLCLQLLGLDQNFKTSFFSKDMITKVIIPNCAGATIPGIPGTPSAPIVTTDVWKLPTEQRICLHQKWRRKLSIFEKKIGE